MKWTPERDKVLIEMYEGETPTSVIAKVLGVTGYAVRSRVRRLGIADPLRQQRVSRREGANRELPAYNRGLKARLDGSAKIPPSDLKPRVRAWWLAGWHDKDMELGVSVL